MDNLMTLLNQLHLDESGQDMIEYALLAALIGLGAIASLKGLATAIKNGFDNVGTALTNNV